MSSATLRSKFQLAGAALFASALILTSAQAADPSVKDALMLEPVKKADVDYDTPADVSECSLKGHSSGKVSGWHVFSKNNQLLRRFLDTNGDGDVDLWCYYKNGVEVYRDIDGDFNGKAEQFRWMGTSGIRWGVDQNEDGKIDSWRVISPEEVTSEVVEAIKQQDTARFQRLLINANELKQLGISGSLLTEIQQRVKSAQTQFPTLARNQRKVGKQAKWIHFGGSQPGLIPEGTKGNSSDIYVYDNVSAVVADGDGKHSQVAVGTLVQVGRAWRLIDVPSALDEAQVARGGYFFQEMLTNDLAAAQAQAGAITPQMQKMINDLTELDKKIQSATTAAARGRFNEERADLLMRIVQAAPNREDRNIWIQQFTDTIGAAMQQGAFPNGARKLRQLTETVLKKDELHHVAHAEFVMLSAEYERQMASANEKELAKIHDQWLKDLDTFVRKHPKSADAPDALLALGFQQEFAGQPEKAVAYYSQIAKDFPESRVHPKAVGAKRRLESVGKPLAMQGKTIEGRNFDLQSLKGKVVLLHYWATWDAISTKDLAEIRKFQAKYARKFAAVGINCDNSATTAKTFVSRNRIAWPQLYAEDSLEGRLANELGIQSLPTMLLIGKDGRVLNNGIHISELESELEKVFN